jgi:hypothetical protein
MQEGDNGMKHDVEEEENGSLIVIRESAEVLDVEYKAG